MAKSKQPRRPNISITWTQSEKIAMMMVMMGFGSEFIERRTNLTHGQINYRIRKIGLTGHRAKYRQGHHPLAIQMLNMGMNHVLPMVNHQIERKPRKAA